jgi:hypothetical protein
MRELREINEMELHVQKKSEMNLERVERGKSFSIWKENERGTKEFRVMEIVYESEN